jgi:hypothetical protein
VIAKCGKLVVHRLQALHDFLLYGIGVNFTAGASRSEVCSWPFTDNRGDRCFHWRAHT